MTNLIVDGFAHYGIGAGNDVKNAMLSGAYADLSGFSGIGQLPWDLANTDLFLISPYLFSGARRVLPVPASTLIVSMYYALSQLPLTDFTNPPITFRDVSNNIIAALTMRPTGAMRFGAAGGGGTQVDSSGPVVVSQTVTHLEILFTPGTGSNGVVTVVANGTTVITATGMTVPAHAAIAQVTIGGGGDPSAANYISNLIIRDTNGSFNNAITGDRKVATLIVDDNDPAHQGWGNEPLHRFGNGILKVGPAAYPGGPSTQNAGVICGVTTDTNLGSLDYTVEGQFRFQRVPTGTDKAVFFSKWDETANQRSYELMLCGPSLNNGNIVFRRSTDGTAATVNNMISEPWAPVVGVYYHVCLERVSGITTLYIDGVPLGTGVADGTAYFAGSSHTALGCETNSAAGVALTGLVGWNDEFRMTRASFRYGAPFTPPVAAFPRGPIDDAQWSDVMWLSGWDSAAVADESGFARALAALNGANAITPNDGGFAFQTINKNYANDDTFIEASFLFASGVYTQTSQPSNNETVTVGTKNGSTPAVYTFKTALTGGGTTPFEVLIGAALLDTLQNLVNAIIAGTGSGTLYGAGTTANFDVQAIPLPINQIQAIALLAGTGGNSIAVSTTAATGTWGVSVTTLSGGTDLPAYSQFVTQHLPNGASIVDSLTIVRRSWKTEAGDCSVQGSLVGGAGGVLTGATITESTGPTLYHDTFEVDPDNPSNPLTPTAVLQAKLRIDRTG